MNWLDDINHRQQQHIKQQGIQKGFFVQPSDCFKGVYYEVADVWDSLAMVYVPDSSRPGAVKTNLMSLYLFANAFALLPDDAYSVSTANGHFSERQGTIRQINPHYGHARQPAGRSGQPVPLFNQ